MRFAAIDLPSDLGLRPSGVAHAPEALRREGLLARLEARDAGRVEPAAPYRALRDDGTGLLNGPGLRATTEALAAAVAAVSSRGEVPLVLAGDCSVVLGGVLGLRRAAPQGRFGLLFVDGHLDFDNSGSSPTGEVADMDLALVTGRGPEILTRFDGETALVRDEDVAAVGARDREARARVGTPDVRATGIRLFEIDTVRERGIDAVAQEAVAAVARPELAGFWLHVDADVLDDAVMPAVDYRQPGGLAPDKLRSLLRRAGDSGRLAGVSVAIYNPALDPDRGAARVLVECLAHGLGPSSGHSTVM